jgi:peptidyl-prolyl cis-trans isomerase C
MLVLTLGARGPNGRRAEGNGVMRSSAAILTLVLLISGAALSAGQQSTNPDQGATVMAQKDPTSGPNPAAAKSAPNPAVLRVNGDPIYAVEISMVMQTLQSQLQQRGEKVDQRELAKVATQRAIEQKLLVQEARRFGVKADEMQVARAAQLAEQQAGGRAMLEAKLKATGSNYDQFLEMIREVELMRAFVAQQITPNVVVTDEEIAAYYEANPKVFEAEERVHAYHMIFIVGEDADPAALADKRAKAEAARQRALTGDEDFTVVARELSEGPSAPNGGDLGWVTRGALVSPLSETVFSLEPGQISEVVQSRFGFHVATISDHRPAETISLEEASDQIKFLLQQQEATEVVGQLLETLSKNAKVENLLGGPDSAAGPSTGKN